MSLEIFFFFFSQYFDPKNCIRIGFFVILHQSFVQLNESLKSIFKHSNLFLCGPATQLVVRPSIVQTIPNQSYGLLLLDFDSYYVKHFFANKAHVAIAGTLKMGSWPHLANSVSFSATYPPTPMMPTVPPHYPSVPWQRPTGRGNNRNRDRIFRTTTTTTTTTISTTTPLPPSK